MDWQILDIIFYSTFSQKAINKKCVYRKYWVLIINALILFNGESEYSRLTQTL